MDKEAEYRPTNLQIDERDEIKKDISCHVKYFKKVVV